MCFHPFLTPAEIDVVSRVVGKSTRLLFDGGYPDSEMKVGCIAPLYEEDIHFPLVALSAKLSAQFSNITHRDVLGALMNCGIKRSQFGDLLVEDDRILIFVKEEIADYIRMNVTKLREQIFVLKSVRKLLFLNRRSKRLQKLYQV